MRRIEPIELGVFAQFRLTQSQHHVFAEGVARPELELEGTSADAVLDGYTPLQLALAGALRTIPWGETVSYGELSALAGAPRAPRAAGAFCAQNQIALILPCHRVVASVGIGGYGSDGVAVKRRLLALEGVHL